jgi:HrpA-like RNA helicase
VSSLADAVLVFLPGFKEIQTLHELLLSSKEFGQEPQRSWVLPLHSLLPPEEQRKVFDRPPPGVRKVVLSTNIAETAVTVDDCGYVIDTGRMKEKRFDPQECNLLT